MKPIEIRQYTQPPPCMVQKTGVDSQSDLGQQVNCGKPAVALMQVTECGATMQVCEDCLPHFDGRLDWRFVDDRAVGQPRDKW